MGGAGEGQQKSHASLSRHAATKLSRLGRAVSEQRLGVLVVLFTAAFYLVFYLSLRAHGMPGNSDPHYIWLYARSLVFDHDYSFANDYALCGDPFKEAAYAVTAHAPNPYYLGPSLFWAPVLFISKLFMRFPPGTAKSVVQGCSGPLVNVSMTVGPLLGGLTLWFCYRAARRFVGDGVAALAIALFGLAGLLAGYAAYQPGYSHVYATFAVALLVLCALRAQERPHSPWRWICTALALALAIVQRPPQIVFGLLPWVLSLIALREEPWTRRLRPTLYLAMGALLGVLPLLLLYKYMYGSYFANPMGNQYLHLLHAHPFLLLFAPHGGLFYTTPVAWLAVAGLWPALRRRDTLWVVAPLIVAGAIQGYVDSAVLDWHGAGTFGARRLTSLTPLFVLLTAVLLDRIRGWLSERPARALTFLGVAVTLPLFMLTTGMLLGYAKYTIPCCQGSSQANLYGEGQKQLWAAVDRNLGDVAVLPASLPFAWWYGIDPRRFRDATESKFYIRDVRAGRFIQNRVVMTAREAVTTGFRRSKGFVTLIKHKGAVVFAAEWPFATDVIVEAASTAPVRLRIGRSDFFGVTSWGEIRLDGSGRFSGHRVPIPDGDFDSGVLKLVFECDAVGKVRIRALRFEDAKHNRRDQREPSRRNSGSTSPRR